MANSQAENRAWTPDDKSFVKTENRLLSYLTYRQYTLNSSRISGKSRCFSFALVKAELRKRKC